MSKGPGSTRTSSGGRSEIDRLQAWCCNLRRANRLLCGIFDGLAGRGIKLSDLLTDDERHALLTAASLSLGGRRATRPGHTEPCLPDEQG